MTNFEMIRHFFLWCTIINYGIVVTWFLIFTLGHDWMLNLHSKLFNISNEQFDRLHYAGIMIFKIGIMLFNLVPFIALSIIR